MVDRALRYATQFWFSVVVRGQWIFAAYIVAVYGRSAAAGDFAKWTKILPHGWEAGNHLGNTPLWQSFFRINMAADVRDKWRTMEIWTL
jgi:hypothetical protein